MIDVKKNEATAAYRRMYFHCVDVTDGMTPETGEAGGQPEVSVNGDAFGTQTIIGVLVAIGNGRYYAELTQAGVNIADRSVIEGRYKSANTAEAVGTTVQIREYPVDASVATVSGYVDKIDDATDGLTAIKAEVEGLAGAAMRGTDSAALASVCTEGRLAELDAANLITDVANVKIDTAAILVDTGTTLDGKIDTIDTIIDTLKAHLIISQKAINDATPTTTKFITTLTEATNDYWNNAAILFTTGANTGVVRSIKDYVGGTKEVTLNTALPVAPSNGDAFSVIMARAFKLAGLEAAEIEAAALAAVTSYDPPTRAEATTDKEAIITQVDANETKIDVIDGIVDDIKTEVLTHPTLAEIEATTILAKQATLDNVTYGLSALKTLIDAIDTSTELQAKFTEIKGAGWTVETLKAIKDAVDIINIETDALTAIKTQTDKLTFTGSDVKATLDGEEVTPAAASKTGYALTSAYDSAKTAASQISMDTANSTLTTIINRIGAFTGTGWNTVLGFFKALMRKDVGVTLPTDVGGTFSNITDSLESIKDSVPSETSSLILGATLSKGIIQSSATITNNSIQKIRRGDCKLFTFNLGSGWNLTGKKVYLCVKKSKTLSNTNAIINTTCGITDYTNGICTYTTNSTDTSIIGIYFAELEIRNTDESNPITAMEFILEILQDNRQ